MAAQHDDIKTLTEDGIQVRVHPHTLKLPPTLHPHYLNEVLLEHVIECVLIALSLTPIEQGLSGGIGIVEIPCFLKRISVCIKK